MADESEPLVIKTAPGGVYHGTFEEPVPERGGLGYAWDKGVGLAQGAIDIAASPFAAARDVAYYQDDREAAQRVMEAAADAKRWLSRGKTQYGQAQEEGKVPADDSALGMVLDAAPAALAIGGAGTVGGPVVGGMLAHGIQGSGQWDMIRRAPDEVLKERNPKYAEYRDQGMSIDEAKQAIYKDRLSWESVGLNVGANALMAGIGQRAMSGVFGSVLRTDAGNMALRIAKNVGIGGAEGGVAGLALGAGTEAGTQAAEIGEGFRTDYDWDKIKQSAYVPGVNLTLIGGVAGGIKGFREPARPIPRKIVGKTDEILDNTGYTPPAVDEIGADLLIVGAGELGGQRPAPLRTPNAKATDVTQPNRPGPGEVTPPGTVRPGEAPPPAVTPPEPVAGAPPPVATSPPRPVVPEAAPIAPAEVRPPVAPAPAEARPAAPVAPVAEAPARAAAEPTVEPTVEPTAETVRPPMTLDELKARAADVTQTPDVGTLQQHIEQYKTENDLKSVSEINEVRRLNREARDTERKRVNDEKLAALRTEREVKAQAAAEAKAQAAAKAEPAAEGAEEVKAPTVAEGIQERVAARRAQREAEGQPVAPAEPTIGEKVAAKLEEPKPEKPTAAAPAEQEVTPPGKAEPLTGEAAKQAIAKAAEAKRVRQAAAAETQGKAAVEAAVTEKESDQQGERREVQKTKRELAAKNSFAEHKTGVEQIAPLEETINKGKAKDVAAEVGRVGEVARNMVADYQKKLLDLRGGAKEHPIYMLGKWGAPSRAGHGDYHSLMSHMNNLGNGVRNALDKGEVAVAKARAKGILDLAKRTNEGRIAEITAEKKAESDRQTTERRTSKLGEKAEAIKDERPLADEELIRKEDLGEGSIDPKYPTETGGGKQHYVKDGPEPKNEAHVDDLAYELHQRFRDLGSVEKLTSREANEVFREYGEKVKTGKAAEVLAKYRPDDTQPVLQKIYDAVYDVVKDMPVDVWSRDQMEAYYQHLGKGDGGAPLAFYSTETGRLVFRNDTLTPVTIFHESIHAATSRALKGSQRLEHLVLGLQRIIEKKLKNNLDITSEEPFQVSIKNARGEMINPREFIAELFSRPEVFDMIKDIKLTPDDVKLLRDVGYRTNIGKNILKTLWDGFLEAIGFKARTPNAQKVAIDLLQDMFEREMKIRETDAAIGRPTGSIFNEHDQANLMAEDPVGGPALVKKYKAGDYPAVANQLMNSAHLFSERSLDKAEQFLTKLNEDYYGHRDNMIDESRPFTPMSNTEQVRGGVEKFLGDRFGRDSKAADIGYQADKWFATPIRHFAQGLRYTQDLGNNLEQGFRDVIQPIKDAWSRREHFAQEYMDKSGANKLIDDLATLKNAIKDRGLWNDFETLLVRESYTRAFADEELGVGRNSHINTGSLRDVQTVADHKANQDLMNRIRARDPGGRLLAMRNRIHEFEAADLENRKRAQASDMLIRMNIVDQADRTGIMALIRDVRNEAVKMTPEEKTAFDRIVGKDHTSKQFEDYVKNREVIRSMLDQTDKNGPHVPFMRHGNHVVTANYHVKPDENVRYHQINPKGELQTGYDFENRADAQNFVKNVLSREDIQITQTGGREVVYDTRTGEQAKIFTVEKKDGTAVTFEDRAEAQKAAVDADVKIDSIKEREITPEDVEQRAENNQPTSYFKVYNRVEFNPREYIRFDSERAANEYRNRINLDTHDPNFSIDVRNVETPRDIGPRGVAQHASSEMTQWANRIEASPAYQKMTPEAQAEWKRELNAEAARVTMMTGRRSINLPREYVKGASTDILKNMIQSSGSSARAIAGNMYNPRIAKAREAAGEYVKRYQNQTGGFGKDHRARADVLAEFDRRLHAPIKVDGSWSQGIKRALQVSMISHLADASFLVINAMEPWVLGGAITAARHGWYGAYSELAKANALVDPIKMARMAGEEIYHAGWKGEYRPANYEAHLLDAVKGEADAKGLSGLLRHMFGRGLTARDTGMEVERIHDPSSNILGRATDRIDATFRGGNTGIETLNRSTLAISNYRLEFRRAIKEGKTEAQADAQAIRYAEDMVFKGAGDYGSWNSPRYFNNPFMKLATQFKKYPLRIASVYADALIQAVRGDKQAMKQVAYMLGTQGLVSGALGLPIGPLAGTVNAAYILGLSDDKWSDKEFALRKWLVDQGMSPEATDMVLRGALRWTGADFHPRLTQSSMVFFGDPETRDTTKLLGVFARTLLGSPGGWGANGVKGVQQLIGAASDYHAGAYDQAEQKGMQGVDNIIQIKALHNLVKAFHDMTAGPLGMPKGNEATTGQAVMQAIGFGPVQIARKQEQKRTMQAAKKQESEAHNRWVNRWRDEPNVTQQGSIWAQIQKEYNPTVPAEQRIKYGDLVKAKAAKAKAERRDDSKLGVPLSGRQKGFADIGKYFQTQ